MIAARDHTTLRRALKAGALAGGVVGVPLLVWALIASSSLIIAAVIAGLTAGIWLGAGWLFLALGLDLLAGEVPGGARVGVTLLVGLVAILMPFLLLAAAAPG